MSGETALDRLCAYYGIVSEYTDVWGKRHQVSERTRRALLSAMGASARDAEEAKRRLNEAQSRAWKRMLPPVSVLWEDTDSLQIEVTLPTRQAEEGFRWSLQEEYGRRWDGEVRSEGLEVEERRALDDEPWVRCRLDLPLPSTSGYHRLELTSLSSQDQPLTSTTIIVAPRHGYQPEAIRAGGRLWGFTAQLYSVRSRRNWGIGDFTDLTRLIEWTAEVGASFLEVNPLHALFPTQPERCNPYSPSSRRFLNLLYLDLEAMPDFAQCAEAQARVSAEPFQAHLRALRAAARVDYQEVAQVKRQVLEDLYHHFREYHLQPGSPRAQAFRAFQADQGEALRRHTLFEALQEHLQGQDPNALSWQAWPAPYRDPDSTEVAAFAEAYAERLEFFAYLHWQAHLQLQSVGRRSFELGLGVGLHPGLAVSVALGGAEVWADPGLYALDACIGTPPDTFNLKGQYWELSPWRPERLREMAYAPFIATLRQNMCDAGALHIDHVMALLRPYWIPKDASPADGAYVHYPMQDLLSILALESQRNHCLLIGDDRGPVPEAIREVLQSLGVLSSRLFYFERDAEGGFKAPADYEPQARVSVSTHDRPTLIGFWQGGDLEVRRKLDLFPSEQLYQEHLISRAKDRAYLLLALEREGLLPPGMDVDPVSVPEMTPDLARAIHVYLARTPARLMGVQLEDLLGEADQANLPGSGAQRPNWQRKLPLELEAWEEEPNIVALLEALRKEREVPAHVPPPPEVTRGIESLEAEIPSATYRLQLHAGFNFAAAADLVPYLAELGISHCYFSPYFAARPGSAHGYDVIDHSVLNPELGTYDDFERLCETLKAYGMRQILDMVPNHVGVMGRENRWWLDVLENGPASRYGAFFDIDWEPLKDELRGKVLLPLLGDHYGNVLDHGELKLIFDSGAFYIDYYAHRFPIDPREYPRILGAGLERLQERLGAEHPTVLAFGSLLTAFANLPARSEVSTEAIEARQRDKEIHKQRLVELGANDADLAWYVEECLREFNGTEDYPADPGRLHDLLEAQAYRLAYWRVASDEINYRRFFDINDLAALRMENADVFQATHHLVLELVAAGKVHGLRIDHPDGLYDPAGYFQHVQAHVATLVSPTPATAEPKPLYLVVEKILGEDERLPPDWAVHGTTGYDFANLVGGLLVDGRAAEAMTRCYEAFVGETMPLAEHLYVAKKLVMQTMLSSELHVLARELSRIAESDPHTRDYTLDSLRSALMEIVACFPVYRTYITEQHCTQTDRDDLRRAVRAAKKRSQAADTSVFDFVNEVLSTALAAGKGETYRHRVLRFAMKFQQYTSPVTAKGMEDTAFYRYHRLVSLNEVGGEPEHFGVSVQEFHRANGQRSVHWPHAMLNTSTHDSKRSEDLRARLHVLSELSETWQARVNRWAQINRRFKRRSDESLFPDANTEYLLYQTLVGVWPLEMAMSEGAALEAFRGRIRGYMEKAVKEAKVHTSWINPDPEYEEALLAFVDALLDPARNGAFMEDFLPFQRKVARLGLYNSLSQVLLKLTSPGVPDIYQGNELWDFSLVDPDNRRAVDFAQRRAILQGLAAEMTPGTPLAERVFALLASMEDGRTKLYLTWRCLGLRRAHPQLFAQGDYQPLIVQGERKDHLCAFARRLPRTSIIAVAPRLLAGFANAEGPIDSALWRHTSIEVPVQALQNVLTGETLTAQARAGVYVLAADDILRYFPVGLLLATS